MSMVTCDDCNIDFHGQACFDFHKSADCKVTCGSRWKCKKCWKMFVTVGPSKGNSAFCFQKDHDCHKQWWCKNCRAWADYDTNSLERGTDDHVCYMKPSKAKTPNSQYLFADFECRQDSGGDSVNQHVVNFASTCTQDGKFWKDHTNISDWLDELLFSKTNSGRGWWGSTVIFHNGRGYDFQFILNEILSRTLPVSVTVDGLMLTGSKILYFALVHGKRASTKNCIRFVDSLNFLTMSLKNFAPTFGLKTAKGDFPHLFNIVSNQAYVGPLPAAHFFGRDSIPEGKRLDAFDEWHASETIKMGTDGWVFKDEMKKYCRMDVEVLRRGCMKFRDIVMSCTSPQHDPFTERTLASSAMAIFKTMFLNKVCVEDSTSRVACLDRFTCMELRESFFGGRTGPTKLYYKCGPDTKMRYADFTSMYPAVCKYGRFPSGTPIKHEFSKAQGCKGISGLPSELQALLEPDCKGLGVFCVDVYCPQKLYLPVLPSKSDGKGGSAARLMFDLQPKFHKSYTNLELRLARSKGYLVSHVYYCYYWEPEKVITGLFQGYVDLWLKHKQQAAGFKGDAKAKLAYCAEYLDNEGVRLDPSCIAKEKNNGLYQVSKFYLNSLWGKFAQRLPEFFGQTHVIQATKEGNRKFRKMARKGQIDSLVFINEHTVIVKKAPASTVKLKDGAFRSRHDFEDVDDVISRVANSNIAVALFVTSQGRIKLYETLATLGERVVYYDTDSVVFVHRNDADLDKLAPLGRYLGDLTSEIGDSYEWNDDSYITEFISTGPKSYAYKTNRPEIDGECIKIKGLPYHSSASIQSSIDFEALKQVVLNDNSFVVKTRMFKRDSQHRVFTDKTASKILRNVFMKRRVMELVKMESKGCFDEACFECGFHTHATIDCSNYLLTLPMPSLMRAFGDDNTEQKVERVCEWNEIREDVQVEVSERYSSGQEPVWLPGKHDMFVETLPWKNNEEVFTPNPLSRVNGYCPCIYAAVCANHCQQVVTDVTKKKLSDVLENLNAQQEGCSYEMLWRVDGFNNLDEAKRMFNWLEKFDGFVKKHEDIHASLELALYMLDSQIHCGSVLKERKGVDRLRTLSIIISESVNNTYLSGEIQRVARQLFNDTTFDVIFSNCCNPDVMMSCSAKAKKDQIIRQKRKIKRKHAKRKIKTTEELKLNPFIEEDQKHLECIKRRKKHKKFLLVEKLEENPDLPGVPRHLYIYNNGEQSGIVYDPFHNTTEQLDEKQEETLLEDFYKKLQELDLPKPFIADDDMFSASSENYINSLQVRRTERDERWARVLK